MDGRYPTENDYDYYADMMGADHIRIASSDSIFNMKGDHSWDPEVGIMVVVGVLTRTTHTDVSLTVSGPSAPRFNFTDVATNVANIFDIPFKQSRLRNMETYVYRWFNWGALDFTLSLT